jgi:hypothetical protein
MPQITDEADYAAQRFYFGRCIPQVGGLKKQSCYGYFAHLFRGKIRRNSERRQAPLLLQRQSIASKKTACAGF